MIRVVYEINIGQLFAIIAILVGIFWTRHRPPKDPARLSKDERDIIINALEHSVRGMFDTQKQSLDSRVDEALDLARDGHVRSDEATQRSIEVSQSALRLVKDLAEASRVRG